MNMKTLTETSTFRVLSLLLCFCFFIPAMNVSASSLQADKFKVSGIVKDATGEPVIGASVVEKGTTNGTVTDLDGNFNLSVASNSTIVISFIGYSDQEFHISKDNMALNVNLKEDTEMIDEVVVVGYGVQKKENLTGSVAAVNFKDVASMPVANTANMLQGRLPGVMLTNNGAQAGHDSPEIRIRGVGTFEHNDPMVLIDGVESSVSQIAEIPADDIESVSVLKDAASASIYGVRAANGVILVTTKRGGEQKPTITYSGSIALQEATVLPDYVNSYEWAKMYNECWPSKAYTDDMLQKLQNGSDPDHFANTNWAKEMFRTAAMHQHHLSVNGGSKAVHYMISTQYFQQDGILRETANQRFNFRSNLDAQLGIVKLGLNLSGSRQNIDEPTTSVTGEGLMRYLTWFTRPTVPVRYSNGHYGFLDGNPNISQSVFKNPIEALNMGYKDNKHYRFDGKFFGEIDIMKGLKFRSSLAYKYYMNDVTTFNPKNNVRYDAEGNALTTVGTNKLTDYHYLETTYINENILTYDFSVGKHSFNLLAGHSIQATRWDKNEASKQGFATDNIYEMDGGTMNDHVTGSAEESSLQSFFGRLNYNYGGRYLLEMNVRHDGSSRMPKAHRYATFPSFSGAWIMTNEKFMENVKFLHSLKLRGSWGKLGNQEIGNYAYAATLAASGSYYFGDSKQIGMKTAKIPNENIKWETTTITDFGFDAAFWGGKINVTFDWYEKNTSDILMKLAMPGIFLGSLDAPYQNAGKVRNRGWELAANYFDQKGDWAWQAGFSLSGVKNEITDMKGVEDISNNTINREGEAIGSYYGLKAIGIYRTQADLDRVNANGQKILQNNQEPQLGDIMYEDIDNNGNINDADRTVIGNPFPKMQYSFNLGFSYKDFDVNTFWQTPDDALMALASCYDALQSNQLYNSDQYSLGPLYMDCISDNGGHFNWSGWMEGYDMAMGIHTPSSSIIGSYWKDCYEVISRCNVLIANIDRVDMDASQKAIYQAEAKTIRALMYINLTMTYQDVPFLTAPLTIDEAECEKTDRAAIVAHIMTDLQDAAEVLPQNASSRGHITKGAALSLLGRVALYNEKWDDAIAAYKQVQGLGYSLDPSYAKLFTQSGETSPEIIFAVRYEGPGMSEGAAFNAHWNTPLEAMNGTIDLADAYYCKDGKPTTDTKIAELNNEGGLDVSKPNPAHFENRDPRLYSTLFVPGMLWNGKGGIDTSASNPYVNVYGGAAASLSTIYVYKYFDPTDTSNSWDNGQDFYVVRYAEVLLSLAEAMVQKGGYAYSDVTALVNEVRQRADVNMPTVEEVEGTSLSKDELLEVIKHERRVELVFEGLRLFDLYRWKELDKAVANIENERTMYGLAYEARKFNGERDYVWPLPTAELDTNKKLVQHDLWK